MVTAAELRQFFADRNIHMAMSEIVELLSLVEAARLYPAVAAGNDHMRAASGSVDSDDLLVAFLYELARDHVTTGVLEGIEGRQSGKGPTFQYTNGWLALWAIDLAARLRNAAVPVAIVKSEPLPAGGSAVAISPDGSRATDDTLVRELNSRLGTCIHGHAPELLALWPCYRCAVERARADERERCARELEAHMDYAAAAAIRAPDGRS